MDYFNSIKACMSVSNFDTQNLYNGVQYWAEQSSISREQLCDYKPVKCLRFSTQDILQIDRT